MSHRRVMLGRTGPIVLLAALVAACGDSTKTTQPIVVTTVVVTPGSQTITTGETLQLTAQLTDAGGNPVTGVPITWSSSDTNAAPISEDGVVAGVLPGGSTITATSEGVSGDAEITIDPAAAVQLSEGGLVGDSAFATGDTPDGGQGDEISGVACGPGTPVQQHLHSHLSLIVNGEQKAIPMAIGVKDPFIQGNLAIAGQCFYYLHTHDRTGIIHVETPTPTGSFTLGQFFDVWGEPLSSAGVAGFSGPVRAYVDGERYAGDPRSIVLTAHQQITLEVGTPVVAPPIYAFPPSY